MIDREEVSDREREGSLTAERQREKGLRRNGGDAVSVGN